MKKFRTILRSLFITRKRNGKEGPGFGVIALICVTLFVVAWMAINNLFPAEKKDGLMNRAMQPKVAGKAYVDVGQAASSATSSQPPPPKEDPKTELTYSERLPVQTQNKPVIVEEGGDEILDTVRIASTPKRSGRGESSSGDSVDEGQTALQPINRKSRQASPDQPAPLYGQPIARTSSSGTGTGQTLEVYAGDPPGGIHGRPKPKPQARPYGELLLPTGTQFPVIFKDRIQTLDFEGLVKLQVVGHVRSPTGKILIPDGTLIYGHAAKKNLRSRIAVTLETIVFENGKEVPVRAILKDQDGQLGVKGDYYPEPIAGDAIDMAIPAITTWLESRKDVSSTETGMQANRFSTKNTALDAVETATAAQLQKKRQEIHELYQAYTEIREGTLANAQIIVPLDFDETKSKTAPTKAADPVLQEINRRAQEILQKSPTTQQ